MLMDQAIMTHLPHVDKEQEPGHIPVMLNEIVEYLRPGEGQTLVDATVGLAGHAQVLSNLVGNRGRIIGIDQDAQILSGAEKQLSNSQGQFHLVHDNFRNVDRVLSGLGIAKVDGILIDCGLSSVQLNNSRRGFGFREEGPLDMRMNQENPVTAYDLVNSLSEKEISDLLRDFGQERWHHRIARAVVRRRTEKPIETTVELSDLVLSAMPRMRKWQKIHPATRTFQAFRIAVNRELEGLEEALAKCGSLLNAGGRMAVIAFHSLEDRIVKQAFKHMAHNGVVKIITKKPLRPSEGEIQTNPRARSARLRIAERI